jgi:TBC1 domain family member 23
MPCELEQGDVIDFCSLAQYYSMKTPSSFKTDWLKILFSTSETASHSEEVAVSQALCLPVSVYELVENSSMESPHPEAVKFFLVDCRPSSQYNAGHLSTAFHLDCNLMLQEPVQFQTAVQGLLRAQRHSIDINSAAAGEHLCFLGSGRDDEDMVVMMVVASFLQKGTQYVSLLTGGYRAIHEYFGDHMVDCLEDHDPVKCLICNSNKSAEALETNNNNNTRTKNAKNNQQPSTSGDGTPQQKSIDFFGKISAAMKTKSAEVKGKLIDYIVNPAQGPYGVAAAGSNLNEKHVSSTDKNQKKYRNLAPVFSIDEDNEDMASVLQHNEDDDELDGQKDEIVSINAYLKSSDVKAHFKCQEVHINGCMYDSYLLITDVQIVVLRETGKKDQARIIVRRPLSSIVKITAKKRHRDLITFKYGVPDGDTLLITDMDRFLIPNASEATQVISKFILNSIKNSN